MMGRRSKFSQKHRRLLSDEELIQFRSCPFCGEIPNVFEVPDPRYGNDAWGWVIECRTLGCLLGRTSPHQNLSDLVDRWNLRCARVNPHPWWMRDFH